MEGLDFNIINSSMTGITKNKIVSGGINQFSCSFTFNEVWDDLTKIAIFNNDSIIKEQIIVDNTCMIPAEVLEDTNSFKIGVKGVKNELVVYSTNLVTKAVTTGTEATGDVPTPDLWEQYVIIMDEKVAEAKGYAESSKASADLSTENATNTATDKADIEIMKTSVETSEANAKTSETNAKISETNAKASENSAEIDKNATQQTYNDFLAQLGTDVATLVGGKVPISQIPATAITDSFIITSQDELTSLNAQKNDIAHLVENGKITKSWQLLLDDPTVADNWVLWGTSFATESAYSVTSGTAENATMINNKRIISMTDEEYATAVTDDDTYYFTYPAEEE